MDDVITHLETRFFPCLMGGNGLLCICCTVCVHFASARIGWVARWQRALFDLAINRKRVDFKMQGGGTQWNGGCAYVVLI